MLILTIFLKMFAALAMIQAFLGFLYFHLFTGS